MSEGNKLNGPWTWAMIAAAFALGLGAGRYVAAAKSPSEPNTAASPPAAGIVYKIPVSMSQAALGPEDALVTWVEWCDLPDPGCRNIDPLGKRGGSRCRDWRRCGRDCGARRPDQVSICPYQGGCQCGSHSNR